MLAVTLSMPTAWEPWPGNTNAMGPVGAELAGAAATVEEEACGAAAAASASAAFCCRRFSFFALRSASSCFLRTSSADRIQQHEESTNNASVYL